MLVVAAAYNVIAWGVEDSGAVDDKYAVLLCIFLLLFYFSSHMRYYCCCCLNLFIYFLFLFVYLFTFVFIFYFLLFFNLCVSVFIKKKKKKIVITWLNVGHCNVLCVLFFKRLIILHVEKSGLGNYKKR